MVEPKLGWVLLSRKDLGQAEEQLAGGIQGVRDEIGFLHIHSGYANRFFPGTSVLLNRLRYVLFIPWIYQDILGGAKQGDVSRRVLEAEIQLAGRLLDEEWTIGKRSYPQATSQPPTSVYWTALGTWGMLRRLPDGSPPTREQVHQSARRRSALSRLSDDDGNPLEETRGWFIRVPPPPKVWHEPKSKLTFKMLAPERDFVRKLLVGVAKPAPATAPSLLALLAERIDELDIDKAKTPWSGAVLECADEEDKRALRRAKMAAALAHIGRAVYAALVESVREAEDKISTDSLHRNYLPKALARSARAARSLKVDDLAADLPELPGDLRDVLSATISWLENPRDLMELRGVYAAAEENRKGRRARLANKLFAKERRAEWAPDDHSLAEPLGYRWQNIQRLLGDLKAQP